MTVSPFPPDRNLPLTSWRYEPRFQTETKLDEFNFTSGLRLIRRRITTIVVVVALFMTAAVAQISGLKPTYHAESRLMINTPLATTLSVEDSRNGPLQLTSETERLLSRSVAEQVINELQLDKRPEFNPALRKASLVSTARERVRGLINKDKPTAAVPSGIESTILEYYRALRVWRDGQNGVIQIGFDAGDPELAAAVPNKIIGVYLEQRKNSTATSLGVADQWLGQRIVEQRARMTSARDAAEKYRNTWGIAPNDDSQTEQTALIAELLNQQAKIESERGELNATVSALESVGGSSLALQNVALPEGIAAMARDLREQQRNLARVLDVYSSESEIAVSLRAEIQKLQQDLGVAVDRYLQSLRTKLKALDLESESVRSASIAARAERSRSGLAQAELARLQHVADHEQTVLDKLEEQRRMLAAQTTLPVAEVEVLSPATTPLQPEGRGRLFYVVGALIASVSIAVTIAFAVELLDKSVRSSDQMTGLTRIVAAGLIPRLRRKNRKNLSGPIGHAEGDMFRDAIGTIIMSLKQSNGGQLPSSIVVTSAQSGEGKSLVARALAVELVASGSPVLLVDGDLRCGNLEADFKSELHTGLNEFLTERAALRDIIYHHFASGVDFIPAGRPSPRRRPDLAGVTEIIKMASSKGQTVIFDSAPILASSDTLYLTAVAERTLMTVHWGKTSRRTFEVGMLELKRFCNSEVFVALNKVEPKRHALYNFSDSEFFAPSLRRYHTVRSG